MKEEFGKIKEVVISFFKKIWKPALIIFLIVMFLTLATYVVTRNDAIFKEGDKKNTPYTVEQHMSDTSIDEEGEITTAMTAQELWDLMIENGTRVDKYLDSPEELQKLINAQAITDYMDTRENPEEEIDWDSINENIDSKTIQGIVKLRRVDENGNEYLMTYVDPETFQSYITEYNQTGSETAKQNALTHFTLEKGFLNSSSGGGDYEIGTDGTAKKIEAGDTIEIPQGQGYGTTYTYNSWQLIGAGKQLELKKQAGMTFDEEGFGRINGRYTVAVTPKFGSVGDYIDYYYIDKNGIEQMIPCIICDVKGGDANNEYGHHDGANIIEFYVNEETWCTPGWAKGVHSWYNDCGQASSMHVNPGTNGFHEEWQGSATKIVNGGSYFDNPDFVEDKITSNENTSGNSTSTNNNSSASATPTEEDSESESSGTTSNTGSTGNSENEPLKWPTDPNASITSPFGYRGDIGLEGASKYHQGIDIGVVTGTEVYATESGTVVNSEYKNLNGNWIKIDHGNGFESLYLHNSELLVSVGDVVAKGQVIAYSGATGGIQGMGPHLHFAIKLNGEYIDPLLYLYDNGKGNGTGGFGSAINVDSSTLGAASGAASYYAKIATWNEITETITSNDPEQENKSETRYSMMTTKINYQQLVSGYKMPFDYLWALLVISQDKDFVLSLADLVYDSEIEITVYDNLKENVNTSIDTYTKATKVITEDVAVQVSYDRLQTVEYGGPFTGETEQEYTTTTTVTTRTNTVSIALTKADVWIVNYTQEFNRQSPETTTTVSSKDYEDEEYPSEDSPDYEDASDPMGFAEAFRQEIQAQYAQTYRSGSSRIINLWSKCYYKTINRTVNNSTTTTTTKYISSPSVIEEKTDKESEEDNFVTIYVAHRRARNNIYSATSWLFEILDEGKNTSDMVEITKYLLYKAAGESYDRVTEFDFETYKPENFKKLGSEYGTSNLDGVAGQIYDFLLSKGVHPVGAAAVLGNIDGESGLDPAAVNPESGASGLCQWTDSRLANLKNLANKRGVEWTDVDLQLEHMWSELVSGKYPEVYDTIMNATDEDDLEYAVWVWGRYFEVFFSSNSFEASKGMTETRYKFAQTYYNRYKESN